MRVWYPIPPICLDDKRLRGCHLEIHSIYSIITNNKRGYRNHPETKRWKNHLDALILVHEDIKDEMLKRGWKHRSPLVNNLVTGLLVLQRNMIVFPDTWEPIEVMRSKLAEKQSR